MAIDGTYIWMYELNSSQHGMLDSESFSVRYGGFLRELRGFSDRFECPVGEPSVAGFLRTYSTQWLDGGRVPPCTD